MKFTSRDYFFAMIERENDSIIMSSANCSLSYQLYTYGVAIECMLRHKICEMTTEFDAKHDLGKLFIKSGILSGASDDKKEKLACAIKIARRIWDNNLRYGSQKRMNRYIGEMIVGNGTSKRNFNEISLNMLNDMKEAMNVIVGEGKNG